MESCAGETKTARAGLSGIKSNTIRIARRKLLFVAATVVKDAIKYSLYDTRTPALLSFYRFMDRLKLSLKPWKLTPV